MLVQEGDRVRLGQPLARGKDVSDVFGTAPGTGVIEHIHRGERRLLHSVVIRLEGEGEETFNAYRPPELVGLNRDQVRSNLLASGEWLALRTRPFGLVADPETEPQAVFVTAIDTHPLAPSSVGMIHQHRDDFL